MELEAQFIYTDLYFSLFVLPLLSTGCEGYFLSRVKHRNKGVHVQAGWALDVTPTLCQHISECLAHPGESRETTSLTVGGNTTPRYVLVLLQTALLIPETGEYTGSGDNDIQSLSQVSELFRQN